METAVGILNAAYEAAWISVGRLKHGDKVSRGFSGVFKGSEMSAEKTAGRMIRWVRVSIGVWDWRFSFGWCICSTGALITVEATAASSARGGETLVFREGGRGFERNDVDIVDCGVVLCGLVKHIDRRCHFPFVW